MYQVPCQVLELEFREDRHYTDFIVAEGNLRRFVGFFSLFLTEKQCLLNTLVTKVVVMIHKII